MERKNAKDRKNNKKRILNETKTKKLKLKLKILLKKRKVNNL